MTSPEELDWALHKGNKPNPTRFVEEQANENDYWMSLTDAARITRTSEPMVRRWVTTGRLPVRKEPVGINQRTRLVRASDVSLIRPILDPTAAITDDIHKLDLLSIPRQQEQIMHDHQHVMEQVREMRQEIEEHLHQTRTTLEQGAMELQQQMQERDRHFTLQQTEWQQTLLDLQQRYYEEVATQVNHQIQEIAQRIDELKDQGTQHQQALASVTDYFENARITMQEALQELQRHLERLGQDIRPNVSRSHDTSQATRETVSKPSRWDRGNTDASESGI